MCAELSSVPPLLRVTAKRVGAACQTPRANSASAYAAGTVYLEAISITGKATLVSDAEDAAKYRIVKKTIDGHQCLCVDKAGLSIHVR